MQALVKPTRFLIFLFLLFGALFLAKPVLVPLVIAGLLAMLFLPLSTRFERKGISRGPAALLCIFLFLLVIAGLAFLIQWQLSDLIEDMSGIDQKITDMVSKAKQYISQTLGIDAKKQQEMVKEQQSSSSGQLSSVVTGVLNGVMGMAVDTILMLVYLFLLMLFRSHIKTFILKLTPADDQFEARTIISKTSEVGQKYLMGLASMIVMLWVLYGIGFSIVGVKHAIFLAILCGLLEIIPFIGNLMGTGLTILITLAQSGDSNAIIGIVIVYALVQFIQTYLLEPLIVGSGVNINPLFTIFIIVVGETVWGIPGMILALPLLGIVKIICDHIEPLKPYGFLIGEEPKKKESNFMDKVKGWFGKK
ncbi:AI-2E family transporter [Siphonobacter sp. BAB-5405]|uniref:AI-2E family transporter n=1 Tax=Siphonobacter sp. BAB-5405 TaxID=1864825 RepID=UPI000C80E2BB|nr:AI-2E family transporter [Siphonobacter sp. BAB-5405]PMD91641.1 AI-2E family transporter [Siphonobacter sp. BAB-5405]